MKKQIIILIIGIAFLFTSCKKDFLDRQPLDQYSNSSLWTSANDAIAAINGCYSNQKGDYEGNPGWENSYNIYYMDCVSDNAYSQFPWEGFQSLGNGYVTPTDGNATNRWSFTTIQQCNWLMGNIDKTPMDSALKRRIKGEARFLRTYQYFIMTQLYGDVPLMTKEITTSEANTITRTPKADVTKFMLSELGDIAPDLPVSYSGADVGRITKGAALSLKARIELYNQDYADCITDCQSVMQLGYSLYPSYQDLFRVANKDNSEVILDVQYKENSTINNWVIGVMPSNSYGGWASIDPTQSLVDAYEMSNGKTIGDPTSGYDPKNPYANRDPRLQETILTPGQSYGGYYYDPLDAGSSDYYLSGNCSKTGYTVKKFAPDLSDYDNIFNTSANAIVIRYAEILLTYAEAKIESGQIDNTVYDAIDQVRVRAGMPKVDQSVYNTQATLRTLVRRERRVELAMEGLRWFDIQRWQIGQQVRAGDVNGALLGSVDPNTGKLTLSSDRIFVETRQFNNYLWPIPQPQIDINKNLLPNNGY
jgi:hypothetical protein